MLTADSTAVAGTRVVLHRVGRDFQGPIDSTRSDRRGRFRFTFRPDTSAFYLVSGRHAGIEYFSSPLATNPARADTGLRIVVYDTSSSAPVAVEARHLVLTRPGEDGSRSLLELMVLRNRGRSTRVAPDTLRGSWSMPLPRGSSGLQVKESDVSSEAITRAGDTLVIGAALAPGDKQLTLQYEVPPGRTLIELPVPPQLSLNVLVEEPKVRVAAPGVAFADTQVIQGRSFRRWSGTVTSAGVLRITLPGAARTYDWVLPALVAALGLGLLGAGWYGLVTRKDRIQPVPADQLLDAIAALDARYSGRQSGTPEPEWTVYQAERARLKAQLEATLASRGWSR